MTLFQTTLHNYSNKNSVWDFFVFVFVFVLALNTHRSMEQNREPRNKPLYTWSIHGKKAKNIPLRKEHLFNKWYYEKWKATCKRMKLNSSKWIIELNIRTTTVNLRRNIGGKFLDISTGHNFLFVCLFVCLYLTLKARTIREGKKSKKQV